MDDRFSVLDLIAIAEFDYYRTLQGQWVCFFGLEIRLAECDLCERLRCARPALSRFPWEPEPRCKPSGRPRIVA